MSIDEKALQVAIDINGYAKDDYAEMSNAEVVTSIIAIYESAKWPKQTVSLENGANIVKSWCPLLTENGDHIKVAKALAKEWNLSYVE